MTRRLLINAQSPEELRIAVVDGSTLESYHVEVADSGMTRGNIYRGVIASIQPSLNAAFIDYGAERNGFLAIQDVVPEAYYHEPAGGRPRIEDVLEKGKPIVVQVTRDPEGGKGAAMTTNLSLAGRYLVLTPFDDMRGVSRKVEDDDVRRELRAIANALEVPEGCGLIVRTNALDQNRTALSRDLQALLRLWKRVQSEAMISGGRGGAKLLYSDQDLILRAIRDVLDSSIEEVLVDDDAAYEATREYMQAFLPRSKTQLTRYAERTPLFSRHGVEEQIDRIHERIVPLPSGGSIVIDSTEALTAIDVNSGKATRGGSQEETALQTNLEAAAEVARQLRLRDLGGLIVVDFIDMRAIKAKKRVEKAMKDAMKVDRARNSVSRISQNGLVEINRQRISQALRLRTHRSCPTCAGTGRIASPEMVSLNLLRRIEARAATGRLARVRVSLHPELADALQNSRRQKLAALEREFDIEVEVIASPSLHRPEEKIDWVDRPGGAVVLPVRVEAEPGAVPAAAPPSAPRPKKPESAAAKRDAKRREPAIRARELVLPEPPRSAAGEVEAGERKKKRRRGGKKRKKNGVGGEAFEAPFDAGMDAEGDAALPSRDGVDTDGEGSDGDTPAGGHDREMAAGEGSEGDGGGGAEAGRNKRRRRGGRKRKRSGRGGDDALGSEGDGATGPDLEAATGEGDDEGDAASDGDGADGSEGADGSDAASGTKRRRSRRRGGRRRQAGAPSDGGEGRSTEAENQGAPEGSEGSVSFERPHEPEFEPF